MNARLAPRQGADLFNGQTKYWPKYWPLNKSDLCRGANLAFSFVLLQISYNDGTSLKISLSYVIVVQSKFRYWTIQLLYYYKLQMTNTLLEKHWFTANHEFKSRVPFAFTRSQSPSLVVNSNCWNRREVSYSPWQTTRQLHRDVQTRIDCEQSLFSLSSERGKMAARKLGERHESAPLTQISRGHFTPLTLFCITLDELLRERGMLVV